MNYPEFVDAKDVRFFEIRKVKLGDTHVLRVKGLVFHSALAVDTVEITNRGSNINIMVKLTPARKGLSGMFQIDVPVQDNSHVLFGPSNVQVWPPMP